MYVLDTDHASIIQRRSEPDFSRLDRRMRARPLSDFYFTIVTFHELVMGANLYISKAKDEAGLTRGYRLMDEILAQFKPAQVLSFDEPSARTYRDLRDQKIRIGKMDLRIGAIVLSHNMTLLTRNTSDGFRLRSSDTRSVSSRGPRGLKIGALGTRSCHWLVQLHRERYRKIDADQRSFTRPKRRKKGSGGAIDFATSSFHHFTITVVDQPMYNQCSHFG